MQIYHFSWQSTKEMNLFQFQRANWLGTVLGVIYVIVQGNSDYRLVFVL